MAKQEYSVRELVDMFRRSELQLPELQRQYVWRATRVRDLLDSLYRSYPSGTILIWETDKPVSTRASAIEQDKSAFESQRLLLDGQQRITSLTAVMSGELVKVKGRKNPIDILFNLEHPEGAPTEVTEVTEDEEGLQPESADESDADAEDPDEDDLQERLNQRTFVVASQALARKPNWVSVTRVFGGATDREILSKAGVTGFDDPRFEKYVGRLARLRKVQDYPYVVHVLGRELPYEEVAEIFVRVNSLGAKLRSSDLALAQITARWNGLLSELDEFAEECEEVWFTLDTGLLVRAMVVFATGQAKFDRVATTSTEKLKEGWEKAKQGLRFTVNFLRQNAGIEDESILSAPTMMLPIAVFSQLKNERLSADEGAMLLYWLLVANARGRYSRGSSESLLNEDLAILFRGGSPGDLLQPIQRLFGRLDVDPSDLAGRPARSPVFALTYLALRASGAKDWQTGLGIGLAARGKQHVIQYHHIFPKALLREAKYETAEINEIANLAFIGGRTNQRIGKSAPRDYFPEIVKNRGAAALESQMIPVDPALHRIENYRRFLEERRRMLADAINQHMDDAKNGVVPGAQGKEVRS
jgi:hypothetical protein